MSAVTAIDRLKNERKLLKNDLPPGFFARPVPMKVGAEVSKTDLNYFIWICGIPGKAQTIWEGSTLIMYMFFPQDYPMQPPKCQFEYCLPHPNIYPSGSVCLSIINAQQGWKPSTTIKDILLGVQMLLNEPNQASPAQQEAFDTLRTNKKLYDQTILEFCKHFRSVDFENRIKQLIKSGEYRITPKSGANKLMEETIAAQIVDV